MISDTKQGNVVKDFYIGNTHVKICDDYCRDRTKDDIEKILQRIARRASDEFLADAYRRQKEELDNRAI